MNIRTVCYSPWIILFQMTSPQRPALVSTIGTDDTSFSEYMYRYIMYTHTHTWNLHWNRTTYSHCKNYSVMNTPNLLHTHTFYHIGVSMQQIWCVYHTAVFTVHTCNMDQWGDCHRGYLVNVRRLELQSRAFPIYYTDYHSNYCTFIGSEPSHSNILSFLKDEGFSAAHAKILGTHLNLPRATIRTLKKNNADDANGLLYDIIDSWLDQTEPSWEELARALDKCDYHRIARKCKF